MDSNVMGSNVIGTDAIGTNVMASDMMVSNVEGSRILVGKRSEIDVKSSRRVRVNNIDIALFHLSDGSVLAVENKCPHKGGLLSEGMVCDGKVHCPLHDWRIDLRSGKVHEPDDGCVTTFKTEIDEQSGDIYIVI